MPTLAAHPTMDSLSLELPMMSDDAPGFVTLVERIVNGACESLGFYDAFLVRVDNWFDHKWLGWRSRHQRSVLCVPMFTPNRIASESRYIRQDASSPWERVELRRPLHTFKPGRPSLAEPIKTYAANAAFVWYSGNSLTNKSGSLMVYLSGTDGYAWYASFLERDAWAIADTCRVTRHELARFAELGSGLDAQLDR